MSAATVGDCIAAVSAAVSIGAAVTSWRYGRRTYSLAKQRRDDEVRKSQFANLFAAFHPYGVQGSAELIVTNNGPASAESIAYKLIALDGEAPARNANQRTDARILAAGQSISFGIYARSATTAKQYELVLDWVDESGPRTRTTATSMP